MFRNRYELTVGLGKLHKEPHNLYRSKDAILMTNLTLLWYHGVYVTPVLFDSRFF